MDRAAETQSGSFYRYDHPRIYPDILNDMFVRKSDPRDRETSSRCRTWRWSMAGVCSGRIRWTGVRCFWFSAH